MPTNTAPFTGTLAWSASELSGRKRMVSTSPKSMAVALPNSSGVSGRLTLT
jgi:hypothetical protein